MSDEQLLGKVGSWLKETDTVQPDVEGITERAMAEVPRVRQRGRWWPLPIASGLPGGEPAPATGSTAFSALKFVAAGIIVGLFGGLLLAGLLATQHGDRVEPAAVTASPSPSPMTVERLRSLAETVEVEPGVLRVVDDGFRDLASVGTTTLVAGHDGGFWLLSEDGFLQVGSDEAHTWPAEQSGTVDDFEVAPDGTVWTVQLEADGRSIIRVFDGDAWTVHGPISDTRAIEIAADGTVWAMWQEPGSETVALGRLAGGDRQPVGQWPAVQLHGGDLFLTDAGDPWVAGGPEHREGKPRLYRLADGMLQREHEDTLVAADVGPDGTSWFVSLGEILRLEADADGADPESWLLPESLTAEWDSADWSLLPGDAFRVAPDDSIWFGLRAMSGPPLSEEHCGGVVHFDGTTWQGPFLPSHCVASIGLAADGSVWLLAREAGSDSAPLDLFVLTPEVAAADT